ncbi:EF-hand calcium-binding domain-containing protein 7 isoform X3 [Hirundo rustica]|uniref:EF-hand calcium-binding domain-containing protein 7 isoform X3 n=1 Tax=Hirundo rustica TaxID=43150 RepID=UPI0026729337|nr:EF-hand calcium-binding domain-containing protein 7 isoform X3 [Hirundo rustica]
MASAPGNQKATHSENSQGRKSQHAEEAIFYMNCRAAYLTVLKSSLENIKSKEQLSLVLQQAGRNPSQKTIDKYWTSQTTSLNFDDFCAILKKEKPTTKNELLEAFGKIDTEKAGYILHDELCKILTTRGDKMTWEEVTSITKQADFNCNGKLDYNKFCELYLTTSEQCCRAARARLESDPRLRQQHFGNQTGNFSEGMSKPSPRVSRKTDHKLPKGDSRTPSRPSSAQGSKASTSTSVTVGASSSRNTKLIIEPDTMKEWQCAQSKGCFYLEEDGEIISHKYRLQLPQRSAVCITIKPYNIPQAEGKSCHWLSVDTALFILKESETQENLQLVSFTDLQNEEMFGWRGELGAGVYWLLPFTTGCRLRKVKTQIAGEAKLLCRDEDGELALTEEFRLLSFALLHSAVCATDLLLRTILPLPSCFVAAKTHRVCNPGSHGEGNCHREFRDEEERANETRISGFEPHGSQRPRRGPLGPLGHFVVPGLQQSLRNDRGLPLCRWHLCREVQTQN